VDNQLFPSLIGISPLITIHYKSLLRLRIRSSSFLSKTFNLIIISSRRFRVYKNLFLIPFQFAFRLINLYNSLTHYAKGTSLSADCFSHHISSSFHSIFMVLFIFPSRYLFLRYKSLIYILSLRVVSQFSKFGSTFVEWIKYTGWTLYFLFVCYGEISLKIDFVRHYFQYLCWFFFLLLLKKFQFVRYWGNP